LFPSVASTIMSILKIKDIPNFSLHFDDYNDYDRRCKLIPHKINWWPHHKSQSQQTFHKILIIWNDN
jgi:hypothetical protein